MIAVDTNILVRLLTHDDEAQFRKSLAIIKNQSVFVPDTVILETEWVLRYAYEFDPEAIGNALNKLFGLPNVHTSSPVFISQTIYWHSLGLDFADAFHLTHSQQCSHLYTFDIRFARSAKGLSSCCVSQP